MAGDDQTGDRTETATARHLDQARDDGQVPVSREMAAFVTVAVVAAALAYRLEATTRHFLAYMILAFSTAGQETALGLPRMRLTATEVLSAISPFLLTAMIAGSAAVLLQTRFLLHLGGLTPQLHRTNPVSGVKRIFGFSGLVELTKSLVKLGLLLIAFRISTNGDWQALMHLPGADPGQLLSAMVKPIFHLLAAGLLVQGIAAGIDFMWVRFRHARDLRMSKQDIRDELKDTDGNPHIKARIRRIRVMRARKRMMAKVPGATVVITNPTHYAVALTYDRVKSAAPRIVAKGTDAVAARIREVATRNGVPLVANPPVARALYRFELDTEIPAAYYKVVAEIVAYVWRLQKSRHPVG
ncbi:MAG TPA: flagellar biosynthesis protein FlhB [Acetobacteraceae bacterium]|jgi:flagellar biosynthesis protein FlhB|nr:flagellar biosynthesis protein FlhB [Acetobacteraceae bacterium]